jgi:hypothetical protein
MSGSSDNKLIKQYLDEARVRYLKSPLTVVNSPGGNSGDIITVNISNQLSKNVRAANTHSPGTALVLDSTDDNFVSYIVGENNSGDLKSNLITQRKYKAKVEEETKEKILRIKVLCSLRTTTHIQFWVGGHTKKPSLIRSFPLGSSPTARLDNVGRGKNDWIFAYRYAEPNTDTTIGVIYGNNSYPDWELTNSTTQYLSTLGNGYFTSPARFISFGGAFATYETTTEINNPTPPLGVWACSSIAPAGTCTSYSLIGSANTTGTTGQERSGVPSIYGSLFSGGINTYSFNQIENRFYDGSWTGGQEPSLPDEYFGAIGTPENCSFPNTTWFEYIDGIAVTEFTTVIERTLDTPAYAWDAFRNASSSFTGRYQLTRNGESYSRPIASGIQYIGRVIFPRVSPIGDGVCKLELRVDNGPSREIPALSSSQVNSSVSQLCDIGVAPGKVKRIEFSAPNTNSYIVPFTSIQYFQGKTAEGTYLYSRQDSSGTCQINEGNYVIIASPPPTTVFVQGIGDAERTITIPSEVQINSTAWRLKPVVEDVSTFTKVDRPLSGSIYESTLQWSVSKLTDAATLGVFELLDPTGEKVFRLPFDDEAAEFIEADYF